MLRRHIVNPLVSMRAAGQSRSPSFSVSLAVAGRTFFPPSFTAPTATAVNPLDTLRPPAPPCASDARPFGSLNRSLRPMNYSNINSARHTPASPSRSAAAVVEAEMTKEAGTAATSTTERTASPSPPISSAEPARLDLSQLLKKHRAPAMPTSTTTTASPRATQAARSPSEAPSPASDTSAFCAMDAHSAVGRDTVAKAQSIIAENQEKLQAEARARSAHAEKENAAHTKQPQPPQTAMHQQLYKEHCTVGWCRDDFYRVVADVNQYHAFLPWCSDSVVHTTRRVRVPPPPQQLVANQETMQKLIGDDGLIEALQMTATLKVGFSFFNEQYTSLVTLVPGSHITAVLHEGDEDSVFSASSAKEVAGSRRAVTQGGDASGSNGSGVGLVSSFFRRAAHSANEVAKKSILRNLRCDWEFAPMTDRPSEVEVVFSVSFEFKNPMHSKFIMSNVVSLMTRSFENRCERLYGPPSASRQRLPVLNEG